jgi:bacteriorhodopsin
LTNHTISLPATPEFEKLHHVGHITLWVTFAIFALSTAAFSLLSWNVPVSKRLYHVLSTLAALVATLSYFAMATGGGVNYKCESVTDYHDALPDTSHTVCRQIFWARYIDWTLTTPLLLAQLCILAGVDGAHTFMAAVASVVMTLSAWFAAFGRQHTFQKWGWFTISVLAYVFVIWHVALHGARTSKVKGDKVAKIFGGLAVYEFVLWTIYPM